MRSADTSAILSFAAFASGVAAKSVSRMPARAPRCWHEPRIEDLAVLVAVELRIAVWPDYLYPVWHAWGMHRLKRVETDSAATAFDKRRFECAQASRHTSLPLRPA
eukprot:51545-Prymnesium_polylepis.1